PCSRLFLRRLRIRPPPSSTLFPYTTLFRSQWWDLARLEARSSVASLNSSDDIAESGFSWSHDLSQVKSGVLVKWREPLAERKWRSEEHTSELQSRFDIVCRLLLEKKKKK